MRRPTKIGLIIGGAVGLPLIAIAVLGAVGVLDLHVEPHGKAERRKFFDDEVMPLLDEPKDAWLEGDGDVGLVWADRECTLSRLRAWSMASRGEKMRSLGFRWIRCTSGDRVDL